MAEVGVDIVRSRIIKLRVRGVHQDRHQTSEAPKGEIEYKGKLEAYQQGKCAGGVQRATAASHNEEDSKDKEKVQGGKADGGEGGQARRSGVKRVEGEV